MEMIIVKDNRWKEREVACEATCPRCNRTLPYHEFSFNVRSKTGLAANCRKCSAEIAFERDHPELKYGSKNMRKFNEQGEYTEEQMQELMELTEGKCMACGSIDFSVEPTLIIPVAKGGGLWVTNFQPMCKDCRKKRKGDYRPKWLKEWAKTAVRQMKPTTNTYDYPPNKEYDFDY